MPSVLQIGVGSFGKNHKRILEDEGILVATVDINGREDYDDISDVREKYDHVVVCTPPETHFDICRVELLKEKSVFVEKPMAMTSTQVNTLLTMNTKKLQCGMIERYNPIVLDVLSEGHRHLTFVREGPTPIYDDILRDSTIHDIDLAIWYFDGYPIKYTSAVNHQMVDLTLTFDNGTADIITRWDRPKNRSINSINTMNNFDSLRMELQDFIQRDNTTWEAYDVAYLIEEIYS